MNLSDQEILDFDELVDALVEERINEAEKKRLQEWLRESKAARRRYIKFMDMNASLHHYAAEFQGAIPEDDPDGFLNPSRPGSAVHQKFIKPILAIAAVIVLGFVAFSFIPPKDALPDTIPEVAVIPEVAESPVVEPSPVTRGVAVLTQAWGLEWENPDISAKVGDVLPVGTLRILSGLAQVEFYSGATVILEGPADFELKNSNEAFCQHGKIRAIVPEQASGFTVQTERLDVVDLGTEFGMSVAENGEIEVYVFEGRVEIHQANPKPGGDQQPLVSDLTEGESIFIAPKGEMVKVDMPKNQFIGAAGLAERSIEELQARYTRWVEVSQELREDERLLLYYTFDNEKPWSRLVTDQALNKGRTSNGALVGCRWVQGRWPGKGALQFTRGSDRVRIDVPGQADSMTFTSWVRFDRLNPTTTSLLLCDTEIPGSPHWQVDSQGRLMLSLKGPARRKQNHSLTHRQAKNPRDRLEPWVYQTPPILKKRIGEWAHLVTVYDRQSRKVSHYVDGRKVASEKINSQVKLSINKAEVGNWPRPDKGHPSTNFRGRMDELAVFQSALPEDEILRLYEFGRPNALHGWVGLVGEGNK